MRGFLPPNIRTRLVEGVGRTFLIRGIVPFATSVKTGGNGTVGDARSVRIGPV